MLLIGITTSRDAGQLLQLSGSADKCGDRHAPSRLLLRHEVRRAAEGGATHARLLPDRRRLRAPVTARRWTQDVLVQLFVLST